eukprot:scaffold878_cov271-Pinguiococcus_pyrenoidosus.AAC.49
MAGKRGAIGGLCWILRRTSSISASDSPFFCRKVTFSSNGVSLTFALLRKRTARSTSACRRAMIAKLPLLLRRWPSRNTSGRMKRCAETCAAMRCVRVRDVAVGRGCGVAGKRKQGFLWTSSSERRCGLWGSRGRGLGACQG